MKLQSDSSRFTLPRFLEDVTSRHGARPALRFDGCDIRYDALAAEARRVAKALLAGGLAKGARVGVLMSNRPEWVACAFGVALAGGVLVPMNTFATPIERDYVLRHSDTAVLLLQRTLLRRDFLAEIAEQHPELHQHAPGHLWCEALPFLRRVACLGLPDGHGAVESWSDFLGSGGTVSDALADAAAAEVMPTDDGILLYTSGTTAHPKGIVHFQRAAVIQSWRFAEYMDLVAEDRVFTAQPFFWTAGLAMSLGATLAAGATLVLQETFEPGAALALIEAERVTVVHAFPHQEKALAEHPDAAARSLGSVVKVRAGSPLAARAGITKDVWSMHASYGMTETFTLATAYPARTPPEERDGTSGPPLPGIEVRIVDPETGVALPPGTPGEIAVRGITLMRGYHKVEPEHVFDAEGFFRTQDGGFLDGRGVLHWTGRLSSLIKTGGANVSPLEIEKVLANHPSIKVGLAVGVPHPTLGEVVVLCAVVSRDADEPPESEVRAFLRERIAPYKVPRRVLFFPESELAYTGSQKVQLGPLRDAALRRLQAEGAEIEGHRYLAEDARGRNYAPANTVGT
ncbi:MAG TPA: class I adenylate-forming enzyme family protein [Myxococcota bacterium]|nr:class I adenylate-forming enzyme family protein [Myxococcota bacterium]